jgi:hypothetical protein
VVCNVRRQFSSWLRAAHSAAGGPRICHAQHPEVNGSFSIVIQKEKQVQAKKK